MQLYGVINDIRNIPRNSFASNTMQPTAGEMETNTVYRD